MPIITIVAKTGFLMETRVIHMAVAPCRAAPSARGLRRPRRRRRSRSRRRHRGGRHLDDRRRAVLQIVELRSEHGYVLRQLGPELDAPGGLIAAAGGHAALD